MHYKLTKLPSGLRLISTPIPNTESVTVTIWVKVGSRAESKVSSGVSHFLEHMVFKGSAKRPGAKIIAEAIDSFGGEFNASTSKEWTNFYIKAPVKRLPLAFDVLADMVLNPLLKSKDIERERGVIIEEIGMYEDSPMAHIGNIFERLIFSDTSLGRDVIGTRETIKNMKRSHFTSLRDKHYSAGNIVVTVSGGMTHAKALALTKKHFTGLKKKPIPQISKTTLKQSKPKVLLESKKIEQAHFVLGFTGHPRGHKDRFTETILMTILGSGMSSRLFTEVREKRGLAYAVRSGSGSYHDTGYVETYAGVDPSRAEEALKVILDQHYGLANGKYPISDGELKKAKEYVKGHLALSLEDTKVINGLFGAKELLLGKIETPEDIYAGIDSVTRPGLVTLAKKLFRKEKLNLAIHGPFKSAGKFEKLVG